MNMGKKLNRQYDEEKYKKISKIVQVISHNSSTKPAGWTRQ